MDDRTLASPHYLVWEYYECLRRQVDRVPRDDDGTQKQELVLVVFLAVCVVETFINTFFRVVVEEEGFTLHQGRVLKDLEQRAPLEHKIREWPKHVFGKRIDTTHEHVRDFINLKNLRNSLMHFVSSHETIELPGPVIIKGTADVSALKNLSPSYGQRCPDIVRGFAYEIFSLRGLQTEQLPHAFHSWFGVPPSIDTGSCNHASSLTLAVADGPPASHRIEEPCWPAAVHNVGQKVKRRARIAT